MTEWYYRDPQSRKVGPLTTDEFEEHVAAGDIHPETRIWRSGLADWTTYAALLAFEESCSAAASGPTTRFSPESCSFSTFIALGTSATHRPPNGAGAASSIAADLPPTRAAFEECPTCREKIATHLFREVGRRRVCGFCAHAEEARAWRNRLREKRTVDSNWIGKLLVRCALIAAAALLGRVVFLEWKSGREGVGALPKVKETPGALPAQAAGPSGR